MLREDEVNFITIKMFLTGINLHGDDMNNNMGMYSVSRKLNPFEVFANYQLQSSRPKRI